MVLRAIALTNFRSYPEFSLELSPDATLIVGDNATGKTNVLEAIYCLATTKSFRASLDYEMIRWGTLAANLAGAIQDKEGEVKLRIVLRKEQEALTRKQLLVNGVSKRSVDYIGNLVSIYFIPADVELVTAAPSLRRHHLDLFLAQIDKDYKRAITAYGQIMAQRNRLLEQIRNGEAGKEELVFWNETFLKEAWVVAQKREELFRFISEQSKILGPIEVIFRPRHIDASELHRLENRDIAAGQTTAGPHRDDFFFLMQGRDLAHFGSRGEQRTAVLALKLWELNFMNQVLQEAPVFLLDDIFSELDHIHRDHIMRILPRQQTIITTTDASLIDSRYRLNLDILSLENGKVTKG